MSNPEVADHLYVSRKAIEFHLGNIYGKLGITSRRELRSEAVLVLNFAPGLPGLAGSRPVQPLPQPAVGSGHGAPTP